MNYKLIYGEIPVLKTNIPYHFFQHPREVNGNATYSVEQVT